MQNISLTNVLKSSKSDRPEFFRDALNATMRWAGPHTTDAQLAEFVQRQIALLTGDDLLSSMIRDGWTALAAELAIPTTKAPVVSLADHAEIRHQMSGSKLRANAAPRRGFSARGRVAVAA